MLITYKGVTLSSVAWARMCGVTESTMRWRVHHWGVRRAVTTRSPQKRGPNRHGRGEPLSKREERMILRLYNEGWSEDAIAGAIQKGRGIVSKFLIFNGLKEPGVARKRVKPGALHFGRSGVSLKVDTHRGETIVPL